MHLYTILISSTFMLAGLSTALPNSNFPSPELDYYARNSIGVSTTRRSLLYEPPRHRLTRRRSARLTREAQQSRVVEIPQPPAGAGPGNPEPGNQGPGNPEPGNHGPPNANEGQQQPRRRRRVNRPRLPPPPRLHIPHPPGAVPELSHSPTTTPESSPG